MTRDGSAQQRLLAAAVEYVATHGVGDLSLRQLAAGIGTSHRMLLYHFGSREGLLQAVVHEVEQRQRQALAGLWEEASRSGVDPATVTWQFWRRLSDPALWPLERLFFELYGRSLAGGGGEADLVTAWLEPLTALAEWAGAPPERAAARARLGLAVVRGLLLDLLATGDRAGADQAMAEFITAFAADARPWADGDGDVLPASR